MFSAVLGTSGNAGCICKYSTYSGCERVCGSVGACPRECVHGCEHERVDAGVL